MSDESELVDVNVELGEKLDRIIELLEKMAGEEGAVVTVDGERVSRECLGSENSATPTIEWAGRVRWLQNTGMEA